MSLNALLNVLEFQAIIDDIASFSITTKGQKTLQNSKILGKIALVERLKIQNEVLELNKRLESFPLAPSCDLKSLCALVLRDGTIPEDQWIFIRNDLAIAKDIRNFLSKHSREEYPELKNIQMQIIDLDHLINAIDNVFDNCMMVCDDASYELANIRKSLTKKEKEMLGKVSSIVGEYSEYLRESKYYLRSGVFTLPVIRSFKKNVPGLVVDVSDTEQTIFIHPLALVNLQNEIEDLKGQERAEIQRILFGLSQRIKPQANDILSNNNVIGFLDYLQSCAKYAVGYKGIYPILSKTPEIKIINARHPLIDEVNVVANSYILNDDTGRLLVLSGPNAGGKTVALKSIGLFTYMFLSGLPILAETGSSISYFKGIYADIGDSQSIGLDLSTFSGHMKNLSFILEHANNETLVLIDELGIGTEPRTGEAIAAATLDYLKQVDAFGVISSHYQSIKALALADKKMNVGSFAFDLKNNVPKYQFQTGIPGQSYGIELARRMGVKEAVLMFAVGLLKENTELHDFETINKKNLQLLEELETKERQIQIEKDNLTKQIESLEKEKQKLIQKQKMIDEDYDRILEEKLEDAEQKIEGLIKLAYKQSEKPHEVIAVKKDFDALKESIDNQDADAKSDKKISLKDYVEVKNLGIHGVIKSLGKNKAVVITNDGLSFEVELNRLKKIEKPQSRFAADNKKLVSKVDFSSGISSTLNIIGFRVDEGIAALTSFMDAGYGANLKMLKVIHGFGSGQLKKAVREYLNKSHYVAKYEEAAPQNGGGGATMVYLK